MGRERVGLDGGEERSGGRGEREAGLERQKQ